LGGGRTSWPSDTGEDALGYGSQWATLDMGLLLEQCRRRRLIDPLAFHEDATGLFDAGVTLHGELQLWSEPLPAGRAVASSSVAMISWAKALLVARSLGLP